MLESLSLENFKGFGKRTRIPFAPITLIFGENSAGKSSILHSLNLLKQTREARDIGAVLLPRTEHGTVDLGSFQEILFDHNLNKKLSIRIQTNLRAPSFGNLRRESERAGIESLGLELQFHRRTAKSEVELSKLEVLLGESEKSFAKFKLATEPPDRLRGRMYRSSGPEARGPRRFMKCEWISKSREIWNPGYQEVRQNREEILDGLKEAELQATGRLPKVENDGSIIFYEGDDEREEQRKSLADFKTAINFYSSNFTLAQFIERMHKIQLRAELEMRGFVPTQRRRFQRFTLPELYMRRSQKDGGIRGSLLVSPQVPDVYETTNLAGHAVDRVLEMLFPMGPFRRPPERWYIFTGTSPQDVGYRGDLLPDLLFRSKELVDEANEWLRKLEIGYTLDPRHVGKESGDLFEVRLNDERREGTVDVALPDVGFGISQILPFIVQSLASKQQIISIEQPEVHIHPRLQADLGDLLAYAIKSPRNNQFIIETHSEHLVLRLQKLVRQKKLKPEQVSIVYVCRGPDGAKANRLRLDEDGDFMDEWPGGFFPERLHELE